MEAQFPFPFLSLSSIRPLLLPPEKQTRTSSADDPVHAHVPHCLSLVLILHPTMLESLCYLGWQNTQGLSLLLLSSDIPVWSISVPASLCFQQSATDVSLCTKQMSAVSDGYPAEDLNLNNAFPFFSFDQIMFPTSIAFRERER